MANSAKTVSHETLRADKVEIGSDRSFGYIFGGACVIFSLLITWRWEGVTVWWLTAVGAGFILTAIVQPKWLHGPNVLWMKFGALLHRIISPLILGLIFCVAVIPTSLFLRLAGKDPLRLAKKPAGDSFWIDREKGTTDLRQQY